MQTNWLLIVWSPPEACLASGLEGWGWTADLESQTGAQWFLITKTETPPIDPR
jgi:hypothetical protein